MLAGPKPGKRRRAKLTALGVIISRKVSLTLKLLRSMRISVSPETATQLSLDSEQVLSFTIIAQRHRPMICHYIVAHNKCRDEIGLGAGPCHH